MATVTLSKHILFLQNLKFHIYVCLLTIVLKMLPMTFNIFLVFVPLGIHVIIAYLRVFDISPFLYPSFKACRTTNVILPQIILKKSTGKLSILGDL